MSNPTDQTYSFDQEELRWHIKTVKWIGVTGMIIVLLSTPLFVLASMNWSNHRPVDYEVNVNVNETACSYLKQFDLKDHVMLSVYNGVRRRNHFGYRLVHKPNGDHSRYSVEPKAMECSAASIPQCD